MTVPRHLQWLRRRSQGRFELRLAVLVFVLLAWAQLVLVAHAQVPAQAARYRAELVRAAHSQWGLDAPVAAATPAPQDEPAPWFPGCRLYASAALPGGVYCCWRIMTPGLGRTKTRTPHITIHP